MGINKKYKGNGFTLLEILLAMAIMGIIAVFAIALSSSVQHATKTSDTQLRMKEIVAKARAHYRNSEALPAGVGASGTDVPVGATDLNMEQKYRYDAWGAPLRYYKQDITVTVTVIPFTSPAVTTVYTLPDIDYFTVDGKPAAGVIVSDGPNQTADSTPDGSGNITTGGDDIVIPIDATQEAVEIALADLKVLQDKINAWDAVYEGIDNDGDGTVDEGDGGVNPPCQTVSPQIQGLGMGCPPIQAPGGGGGPIANDPNCGTASIDEINDENSPQNYDCPRTFIVGPPQVDIDAVGTMVWVYSLASNYLLDPWGNGYEWGCDSNYTAGCNYSYASSDPHYHKFFSMGPDLVGGGGDDIIP
ncbi:MAG: type II secretion system protein [Thermodesulfobacteriota bacterium]|nr:type II secretion system protein [Thermodesulfobacteriota bacterium]